MATAPIENKYYLKSVHAEIDLFDRKLAHLLKYEAFDTEEARAAAARKLTNKREQLSETAKRLAAEGVEFQPADLPRSFRPKDAPAAPAAESDTAAAAETAGNSPEKRKTSGDHGRTFDLEQSVREYLQNKNKAMA